mgnify:CR=1 FL=1
MRFGLPSAPKVRFSGGGGRSWLFAMIVIVVLLVLVIGQQLDIPIFKRRTRPPKPPSPDQWPADLYNLPPGLVYEAEMLDTLPEPVRQRLAWGLRVELARRNATSTARRGQMLQTADGVLFRLASEMVDPGPPRILEPGGWIAEVERAAAWAADIQRLYVLLVEMPVATEGRILRDERLVLPDWQGPPVRQTEIVDVYGGVFTVVRTGPAAEPMAANSRARVAGRFFGIRRFIGAKGVTRNAIVLLSDDVQSVAARPVVSFPRTDLAIVAILGAAFLSVLVILWARVRDSKRPPVNWRGLLRGADLNELEEEIEGKPPVDYEFDMELPDNMKDLIRTEHEKERDRQSGSNH